MGCYVQAEDVAAVFSTGRFMFVFNTKLCQKDKAAQFATREQQQMGCMKLVPRSLVCFFFACEQTQSMQLPMDVF